jgi:hypothetical protein
MANNPYTAIAIGILAIATAAYMAVKGVNDLEKALLKQAGIESLTGSEEERNKLLAEQKLILSDLASARVRLNNAEGDNTAIASEEGKIARYEQQLGTIDQAIAKSNALSWQNYELAKSAKETADESERLKKSLGGTTTEMVAQAGSIGALNEKISTLKGEFEATGDAVKRAELASQIKEITNEMRFLIAVAENANLLNNTKALVIGTQKVGQGIENMVRGSIPLAVAPAEAVEEYTELGFAIGLAKEAMTGFTNLAIQGFANLVVSGGKVIDMLRNIGKMVLSGAIQMLLKYGLFGAAGFGIKDGSTGLIGKLFGASVMGGDIGTVTPASASLTLDGQFQIRGTD